MKKALLLATILAAPCMTHGLDEWTWQDSAWEAAFAVTLAADWAQTRTDIAPQGREMNPLLGPRPSSAKVDVYMASCLVAHAGIAKLLPNGYRRAWQAVWINLDVFTVTRNYALGFRVEF